MTPDVIVAWPKAHDYPLWRRFIRDERHRFARVLVAFTEYQGHDLRTFVADDLRGIADCFDSENGRDWRDGAVNTALARSDASWVWFTEQDFFITDPDAFWAQVARAEKYGIPLGFHERGGSGRIHPACLFVPRKVIDRTSRYFGQEPVDHFYKFGREIEPIAELPESCFEHLQGTTQNHYLIGTPTEDEAGIFRRDRFREYLRGCLAAGVQLDPVWEAQARKELEGLRG